MLIEELKSKLPKREQSINSFFASCSERKSYINAESSDIALHLEKAKHDLSRAIKEFEDGCFDWTVIKAYYSIHYAGNALLIKRQGVFSKSHVCLIIALKRLNLISDDFYGELREIHSKFSDFTAFEITYSLRRIGQYDVVKWKSIGREDADALISFAKKFIQFVESEVV
ncbi:HEPN domain protein [uncultured archaeon]|nr:HEPN domain protein [uncultured archaeon]